MGGNRGARAPRREGWTDRGRACRAPTEELAKGSSSVRRTEIAINRIVQEALSNAVKSGRATCGVIDVIHGETKIEVTVRDPGAGFDLAEPSTGGRVFEMRERAELEHGALEIRHRPHVLAPRS
jgi:signal transduction histidine kinase